MIADKNNSAELPKGWVWTKLGEVINEINPGFPCGKHNKESKGVPHLRPMNINIKGEIDLSEVKYVLPDHYDRLLKGDILFNNTNSPELLGKTAYIKENTNWAYSNHMTRIRLNTSLLNPVWISYSLHTLFLTGFFKMNCIHHVNQASINKTFLAEKSFILLPPLPEQHRIVAKIEELFTKLNAGVKELKKIKEQLKRYRQAVLKYAFEGKLTTEWRQQMTNDELRILSDEEHLIKYKIDNPDLPELPEKWGWTNVGKISNRIHYGYTEKANIDPIGPKFLRITDIQNNNVNWKSVPYCKINYEDKKKFLLSEGDIVFARTGATVGKSFLLNKNIPEAVFASYLIRIILEQDVDRKYIYNFFQSLNYWKQISSRKLGIGQPNVNANTLSKITIPLPPLPEQQKIIEEIERRFSIADEVERVVDQNLKQAERLRQSILKKTFEGKLVPQNSTDPPASELLKRIKAEKAKLETKLRNKRKRKNRMKMQRRLFKNG